MKMYIRAIKDLESNFEDHDVYDVFMLPVEHRRNLIAFIRDYHDKIQSCPIIYRTFPKKIDEDPEVHSTEANTLEDAYLFVQSLFIDEHRRRIKHDRIYTGRENR